MGPRERGGIRDKGRDMMEEWGGKAG